MGTGSGHSVLEVLRAVEEVAGKKVPYMTGTRRAGDPPVLVANSDKLKKTLGWAPKRSGIADIVRDAWAFESDAARTEHPNPWVGTRSREAEPLSMRIRRLAPILIFPIALTAATGDDNAAVVTGHAQADLGRGSSEDGRPDRRARENDQGGSGRRNAESRAIQSLLSKNLGETGDSGYLTRASKIVENALSGTASLRRGAASAQRDRNESASLPEGR